MQPDTETMETLNPKLPELDYSTDDVLHDLVDFIEDFPSPPKILSRILELTSSPTTMVEDVAEVISSEPSIAVQLLKQSNSAFYGRSRTISSTHEAVVMLGFQTIRDFVITAAASGLYQSSGLAKELRQDLWEHSLATAILARLIAARNVDINPGDAYIGGLLHDIGKIILLEQYGEKYSDILQETRQTTDEHFEAEHNKFGFTHSIVGAVLIDKWNLPEGLVRVVGEHHCPDESSDLTKFIYRANAVATVLGHNLHMPSPVQVELMKNEDYSQEIEVFDDILAEQIELFDN